MIGFLRKINWKLLLVWGFLFAAANSSAVFAAENMPAAKEYLNDVQKSMMDVNRFQYDVTINAKTPMGDVKCVIDGQFQEKPLRLKQNVSVSHRDALNKENAMTFMEYLEQDQSNTVVYVLSKETWLKQIVPLGQFLNFSEEEKAAQIKTLQLVKAAELTQETPSYKYLEVTLDAIQISDAIGEAVKLNNVQDKKMLSMVAMARLSLLAAGDIKYNIKINKMTKMIEEVDLDLTEPIRKGAGLLLDLSNPKDKAAIEDFLTKSTLHIQVMYSKYNQVDSIEIPQDVRDNAKEVNMMGAAALPKNN